MNTHITTHTHTVTVSRTCIDRQTDRQTDGSLTQLERNMSNFNRYKFYHHLISM